MLWFDVETRYKTTKRQSINSTASLWFDVETRYKTTGFSAINTVVMLWFDVETRYKTTREWTRATSSSCGLM